MKITALIKNQNYASVAYKIVGINKLKGGNSNISFFSLAAFFLVTEGAGITYFKA